MRILRTLGVVGSAALLLSASVAFAQEKPTNVTTRVEARSVRAATATTTRKENVEAARARMKAAREEAKARVEASREEAKARVEEKKEKAARRLADIQDKKKQQLAEKLADRFERLNKVWTDHFLKLLERYDEVVQKMSVRSSEAAGKGRDVTAADTAIQAAATAIETARAAVVAQAAKTYVFDPATVAPPATATTTASGQRELMQNIRKAFQALHASLFQDLFALRDGQMKAARGAVQSALQALGQVRGVDTDDDSTATTTASQ